MPLIYSKLYRLVDDLYGTVSDSFVYALVLILGRCPRTVL